MAVDRLTVFLEAWRKQFPSTDISLYAIQAGEDGPIKIGLATKPWDRLTTLQTANPVRLRGLAAWPGSQDEEAALHRLFAADRLEGEWFKSSEELIGLVGWLGCPTCEFVNPRKCLGHACNGRVLPQLPATCQACGVDFDP